MFWLLLLAHFLGDYPLQTTWMVRNKRKWWVVLLHVGIHFSVMFLLAGPARLQVWPYLLLLSGIHLAIDTTKNLVWRWRPKWMVVPYLVDQGLHYLAIWLVAMSIEATTGIPAMALPSPWVIIILGYLLATYVWYITELVASYNHPNYLQEVISQRWPRMVSRGVILTLCLGLFSVAASNSTAGGSLGFAWIGAPMLAIASRLPYLHGAYRQRTLIIDLAVTIIVSLLMMIILRTVTLI